MLTKNLVKKHLRGESVIWCEHIKFWSRPKCNFDGIDIDACGGWILKHFHSPFNSAGQFNFCPICGKKNPYH